QDRCLSSDQESFSIKPQQCLLFCSLALIEKVLLLCVVESLEAFPLLTCQRHSSSLPERCVFQSRETRNHGLKRNVWHRRHLVYGRVETTWPARMTRVASQEPPGRVWPETSASGSAWSFQRRMVTSAQAPG